MTSQLHLIATVSNPAMYESRYRLYRDFRRRMEECGADLYTVELATGDQDFAVTEIQNLRHIQLRTQHEIWYKENLVNIAIDRLPSDWEYVAWVDADILFCRPNWISETIAKLQLHPFVQMFSHVVDLGPNYEPLRINEGFTYRYFVQQSGSDPNISAAPGQPGYAWAARRAELEAVGKLIDWSIMGSNDYFMAQGLIGAVTQESTRIPGSRYAAMLLDWQSRCAKHVQGNIGYVGNTIAHFWHGRRTDRGYDTRWRILVDNAFDPATDLVRTSDGLLQLSNDKPQLRDAIRSYFRSRNEDGKDL